MSSYASKTFDEQFDQLKRIHHHNAVNKNIMGVYHFVRAKPRTIVHSFYIDEKEIRKWYPEQTAPLEKITRRQYHQRYVQIDY